MDNAREHGVYPDLLGDDHQAAGSVERATDHGIALSFRDGKGLTGDHGFIDGSVAVGDAAIHRNFLAGTHPQAVASDDGVQKHVLIAVRRDPPGRLRGKVQKLTQRVAGPVAGAQFQHLPEKHQHDDCGRGLEVELDAPPMAPESIGENAWRDPRHRRIDKGRAGPQRDQGEHVWTEISDGLPAAHEERSTTPQDDGRG